MALTTAPQSKTASIDAQIAQVSAQLREKDEAVRIARERLGNVQRQNALRDIRVDTVDMKPPARRNVPEQSLKELFASRDSLLVARQKRVKKEKERVALEALLEKNKAETARLQAKVKEIDETTGVVTNKGRGYKYKSNLQLQSETAYEQDRLEELLREKAMVEQVVNTQHADLSKLTESIEGKNHVEQQLFFAKHEVAIKEREMDSVNDEIRTMERIYERKLAERKRLKDHDDSQAILAIESDKRCCQSKISKHEAAIRENEVALQHRALQIKRLEHKIVLIGAALQSILEEEGVATAESGDEAVDADELDATRKLINNLGKEENANDEQLTFLDAQIEQAEIRIRILAKASDTTETECKTARSKHVHEIRAIDEVVENQTECVNRMIEHEHQVKESRQKQLEKERLASVSPNRRSSARASQQRQQEEGEKTNGNNANENDQDEKKTEAGEN